MANEPDTPYDRVFYDPVYWHFPKSLDIRGDLTLNGNPETAKDELTALALSAGCCVPSRTLAGSASAVTSGAIFFTYFRPPKDQPVVQLKYVNGSTAAGATPTLVKYGLFIVAANGDLTQIGITANDTTIFAAANTPYPKALVTPISSILGGQQYATALLVITAAALPTPVGAVASSASSQLKSQSPKLCAVKTGETDIQTSYTAAQAAATGVHYYTEVLAA